MSIVQHFVVRVILAQVAVGGVVYGAEYIVLKSGFKLRAERHEIASGLLRLFTHGRGVIELPVSSVVAFEWDDHLALPVPPVPPQPQMETRAQIDILVERLGSEMQLHPALIHSVIEAESNYDANVISPKGAIGLMQLMPATAREFAVIDCQDPGQNIRGGASYLKRLLDRYQNSEDGLLRALAAYNAGPGIVDQYDGLPPYKETRLFVRRVIHRFIELTNPE